MLKDYFDFTRNERNGIIVLITLILVAAAIPRIHATFFHKPYQVDYDKIAPLIAQWDSLKPEPIDTVLFKFNPNTASREDFLKLGLSSKVAQNIINYRTKGGKFYKPENFKKIWDLKEEDYQRLLPYIVLSDDFEQEENYGFADTQEDNPLFQFDPNTATKEEFQKLGFSEKVSNTIINYRTKVKKFEKADDLEAVWGVEADDVNRLRPYVNIYIKKIDINTASAAELQELRGIGEKLSARIVNFRNKLGGFTSVEQMGETYGLPEETFNSIKNKLTITTSKIQKININTANEDQLKAHPYIKWKEASLIIAYREQHGNFQKIDDILNIKAVNQTFFDKIKPYLTI